MSLEELTEFLKKKEWINQEEVINLSSPGEGNMNVVLRVQTNKRTFILKQSRPYVNKYQDIPAPLDRISTENEFYLATNNLEKKFPEVLHFSPDDHLLMMEDLGETQDLTIIYNENKPSDETIQELIEIVRKVHNCRAPNKYPSNLALRKLNHQHIFKLPFIVDNGFDLDSIQPGFQELSQPVKNNSKIKDIARDIGDRYLSPGNYLIHGDYYPGSWMRVDNQLFVLDPEFSFIGFREFDIGVMAGHLILATMSEDTMNQVIFQYGYDIDEKVTCQMAGIEIIRRIIGLAQLPLTRSLSEKEFLLKLATEFIVR